MMIILLLLLLCVQQVLGDFIPSSSISGNVNIAVAQVRSIPISIPQQRKPSLSKSISRTSLDSVKSPSSSGSNSSIKSSSTEYQRPSLELARETTYKNNILPKLSPRHSIPEDPEHTEEDDDDEDDQVSKEIAFIRKVSISYGKYLDVLIMNKKRGILVPQPLIQIASDKQYRAIHRLNNLTSRQFDGHYPPGYTRQRWLDLRDSLKIHATRDPFNIMTMKINTGKSTYSVSSSFSYQLRQILRFYKIRFRHPQGNRGIVEIMNYKLRNATTVESVFELLIDAIESHIDDSLDRNY